MKFMLTTERAQLYQQPKIVLPSVGMRTALPLSQPQSVFTIQTPMVARIAFHHVTHAKE